MELRELLVPEADGFAPWTFFPRPAFAPWPFSPRLDVDFDAVGILHSADTVCAGARGLEYDFLFKNNAAAVLVTAASAFLAV